ncbi:TIP41-like protein isoform X2 [Condylostylus longicornis]|uniref:TIP41-like protein isoform X2 n=1 Tax=Condylostylus longicornis TaxID=2530218 RepID=UPI00244E0B6B|nr:TIP41-like protein isoform X2 [Condylostylus longicornis]
MAYEDCKVTRLPTDSDNIVFGEWTIGYSKSHILKSVCIRNENACSKDDPDQCELCTYRNSLELPHLPDMVFHKNKMSLIHKSGAELYFTPLEALKLVENGKQSIQVACADEWKESRPEQHLQEKFKPFDWTFSTDYQDELHDHGVATLSVKIRVMPSGFFVLLRYFLRVDNVMIKMNDTRFHYEIENDFILKEYTSREAKIEELKNVPPPLFTIPNEIEKSLPIRIKKSYKLFFK